ncbi:MAG: Uma2 family endonuclease [Planctomycetes bacterium]|nr:Uma2 family endonuclease [Planctomycetota bacterium]
MITGEELGAKEEDIGPCELVRGRIVLAKPAYVRHGVVLSNFDGALRTFVEARGLGKVMSGEVGLYTERGPDTVRGGDVVYMSSERYSRWKELKKEGFLEVAPDIVVEIVSGSARGRQVTGKIEEYFAAGVRRVWIASLSRRSVAVYRTPQDFRVCGVDDILEDDEVLPGFRADVRALFED